MIFHRIAAALGLVVVAVGAGVATAAPAMAGGVGDFLSPAFGTNCANRHTAAHAQGKAGTGTGTADGNLAGIPIGVPLNQCGGADQPLSHLKVYLAGQRMDYSSTFAIGAPISDLTAQ
ncbi:chaplin family protein [Streptomyces sp. NPDC046465]|uniref:chaplin family protein n=1 Tax=Streptomyces sp. NPDC046465 TaxID=3155810 RepID=UPI0033D2D00A